MQKSLYRNQQIVQLGFKSLHGFDKKETQGRVFEEDIHIKFHENVGIRRERERGKGGGGGKHQGQCHHQVAGFQ